jgi:hypothetical protein
MIDERDLDAVLTAIAGLKIELANVKAAVNLSGVVNMGLLMWLIYLTSR